MSSLLHLAITIALVIIVFFAIFFVLNKLEKIVDRTENIWDNALLRALKKPLLILTLVIGTAIVLEMSLNAYQIYQSGRLQLLIEISAVLAITWFLLRWIKCIQVDYLARQQQQGMKVDATTIDALSKLARLVIVTIATIQLMQTLHFSISGLLAAGGIGGIAIGFAAKDLLANFFGGLTIYLDRPFGVGDWIRSPDKDIEGVVEYISWRYTRIRRFNKNPLYAPNAIFTSITVENPSRMSHRRIDITIGIRYQDIGRMKNIVDDVKIILSNHAHIDTSQTLLVNFHAFSASSVDFIVYAFSTITAWDAFLMLKQEILLNIAEIVSKHGAEIAFPTRTLHVEMEAKQATES